MRHRCRAAHPIVPKLEPQSPPRMTWLCCRLTLCHPILLPQLGAPQEGEEATTSAAEEVEEELPTFLADYRIPSLLHDSANLEEIPGLNATLCESANIMLVATEYVEAWLARDSDIIDISDDDSGSGLCLRRR